MTSTHTCRSCTAEFLPTNGSKGIYCSPQCWDHSKSLLFKARALLEKEEKIASYLINPMACTHCGSTLEYHKRKNKYCSKSCSASHTNTGKVKGAQTRFKMAQKSAAIMNITLRTTQEDYCERSCRYCSKTINRVRRVYCDQNCARAHKQSKKKLQVCTVCKKEFHNSNSKHLCESHEHMFLLAKRAPFEFKFNMAEYPTLFDSVLIKSLGIKSRLNPNGLVRDHKVSVHDAIKNEYDPYYISHVMNCQLITSNDNLIKGKKSSITYSDLVTLVDEWDGI